MEKMTCPKCNSDNIKRENMVQYCGNCFWHFKGKKGRQKSVCCKVCGSKNIEPNRSLCKEHLLEYTRNKFLEFIERNPDYYAKQYHVRKAKKQLYINDKGIK